MRGGLWGATGAIRQRMCNFVVRALFVVDKYTLCKSQTTFRRS